jgi:hypothetical protein
LGLSAELGKVSKGRECDGRRKKKEKREREERK